MLFSFRDIYVNKWSMTCQTVFLELKAQMRMKKIGSGTFFGIFIFSDFETKDLDFDIRDAIETNIEKQ